MTTFDDREQAFEKKFAHDAEMQFKAAARRNKRLGLWAAEKMGIAGDEAEAYAREVIKSDLAEAGDDDVLQKVLGDLTAKGVAMDAAALRTRMDEMMAEAKGELIAES